MSNFKVKMHPIDFGYGSAPDSTEGSYMMLELGNPDTSKDIYSTV